MRHINCSLKSVLLAGAVALLTSVSQADPVVDGRFDPLEGYSETHSVLCHVQNVAVPVAGGMVWLHQNPVTLDLFVLFAQPRTLVDNTYGKNSIGWGKHVAPSGKNHNFDDLEESDRARFVFTDLDGLLLLDVTMDYISSASGGYASLGVTGDDGAVHFGPGSAVTEWATSLDYNFNTLGYVLTNDSPETDGNYTENPDYAGWVFDVMYELRISGSLFGQRGFGGLTIPEVHDSPNKIGKNLVEIEINGEIPEPASMTLMGLGALGLLGQSLRTRRNRS